MLPADLLPLLNSSDQGKPGELPAFAWPGGYDMFYVTSDGSELCAECATRELLSWLADTDEDYSTDPPVAAGAYGATSDYPQDADAQCDDCGAIICESEEP